MGAPRICQLRRLRKAAGLTQIQLAQTSGVHVQQIRRIEGGEIAVGNITLKNALALAAALGVAPGELIDATAPEND